MSEFKFACPNCGQRIAATDEYAGHQINCPVCQASIVVPDPPAAPAAPSSIATPLAPGAPPPPTPPAKGRLSVSALSAPEQHAPAPASSMIADVGAQAFKAHVTKKPKKNYNGLIAGVTAVVVLGIAGYFCAPWLKAKYTDMRGPSAAELAATNAPPPPPPPELTVTEIWQKVADFYKNVPNLGLTGKFTSVLDYSKVNSALAANGPQTIPADLTVKMSRPRNFRVDLSLVIGPSNITTTGWSAGNGNFLQVNNQRFQQPSAEVVLDSFSRGFSVGVGDVVRLFLDDAFGTLPTAATDWSRTNDETLNGQSCYVLGGTVKLQNVLVWINRNNFEIAQTKVTLDGESSALAMDDAKIKEALMAVNGGKPVTTAQVNQVKMMAKLKGSVTCTYEKFDTNTTFTVAELEPPKPVMAAPPPPPPGGGGGGGGGGRGGGGRRGR
jgi:hypothetical protein